MATRSSASVITAAQSYAFADKEKGDGYVANGEIGIVVGDAYKASNKPSWTKVQFASQPELTTALAAAISRGRLARFLELAYAVTVHKAQGSEFGKVFLVLPARSRLLSREMLYTALTRQMDRVVILHQGDLAYLRASAVAVFLRGGAADHEPVCTADHDRCGPAGRRACRNDRADIP